MPYSSYLSFTLQIKNDKKCEQCHLLQPQLLSPPMSHGQQWSTSFEERFQPYLMWFFIRSEENRTRYVEVCPLFMCNPDSPGFWSRWNDHPRSYVVFFFVFNFSSYFWWSLVHCLSLLVSFKICNDNELLTYASYVYIFVSALQVIFKFPLLTMNTLNSSLTLWIFNQPIWYYLVYWE